MYPAEPFAAGHFIAGHFIADYFIADRYGQRWSEVATFICKGSRGRQAARSSLGA
ncbi:unannotated protein [freshwater metagenome]|uniref:Unannotated protein n=1 Tax=freshwater metagenome TaxID=449393 RepID=A0A6J7K8S3_9ZZZZ